MKYFLMKYNEIFSTLIFKCFENITYKSVKSFKHRPWNHFRQTAQYSSNVPTSRLPSLENFYFLLK